MRGAGMALLALVAGVLVWTGLPAWIVVLAVAVLAALLGALP